MRFLPMMTSVRNMTALGLREDLVLGGRKILSEISRVVASREEDSDGLVGREDHSGSTSRMSILRNFSKLSLESSAEPGVG